MSNNPDITYKDEQPYMALTPENVTKLTYIRNSIPIYDNIPDDIDEMSNEDWEKIFRERAEKAIKQFLKEKGAKIMEERNYDCRICANNINGRCRHNSKINNITGEYILIVNGWEVIQRCCSRYKQKMDEIISSRGQWYMRLTEENLTELMRITIRAFTEADGNVNIKSLRGEVINRFRRKEGVTE